MEFRLIAFIPTISVSIVILLASCQKEPKEKINDKVSAKDPQSLSSSLRVWHGTRTQGNVPVPHGSLLQLEDSNKGPVKAFAGRYAILRPQLVSGIVVDGYFLKLNGSSEYFKVDYTKPRNINGRQIRQNHHSSVLTRMNSPLDGNLDSAIVIVLPANLRVPDTFCVTYWAYDNAGNVSNAVSACITVTSFGTDANGAWLAANWRFTATWVDKEPHDTIIFNRWMTDADKGSYYCNNGVLQETDHLSGQTVLGTDSVYYRKANLSLASDGGQKYEYDDSWKYVDMISSTCSHIVFNPLGNEAEAITGAWSYNSATDKIVLIFEFNDAGVPVEEAWQYDVVTISNNSFIMVDSVKDDSSKPPYLHYIRLEKN